MVLVSSIYGVADAQPAPPTAKFPLADVQKALDRDYDACFSDDAPVWFVAEFEPGGRLTRVTAEGPLRGQPVEACIARTLTGTRVSAFAGNTARVRKKIERGGWRGCVNILLRSDAPIPVLVDGRPVGTTPIDVRVREGNHTITSTTTNGYTSTQNRTMLDCRKHLVVVKSWVDPKDMVPSPSTGP